MTQPTFAIPCEYGFTATRKTNPETVKFSATVSGATPSDPNRVNTSYEIVTVPIDNDTAIALDKAFQDLKGAHFFSQFYFDNQQYKYRIVDGTWTWEVIGPTANVFTFQLDRVEESIVEFSIASLSLERTSRVKTVQFGDGYEQSVPDGINTEDYRYSIETLPLSDVQAANFESSLTALKGNFFYAKFKGDAQVYKYRLDGNRWSWSAQAKDANIFSLKVKRVYDL